MQISKQISEQIRALCEKALEGSEKVDYYRREWPIGIESDEFLTACREDVLNCVEHTPCGIFTRKIPLEWYGLDEHLLVYLDYSLLGTDADSEVLLRCRQALLRSGLRSRGDINCDVTAYLNADVEKGQTS